MPLRKFSLSSRTVHWCPCRQGKFSLLLGTVKIYLEGTESTVREQMRRPGVVDDIFQHLLRAVMLACNVFNLE